MFLQVEGKLAKNDIWMVTFMKSQNLLEYLERKTYETILLFWIT